MINPKSNFLCFLTICILSLGCNKVNKEATILLKAIPYEQHVELQWENLGEGFVYELYAKPKNQEEFQLVNQSADTLYLDFNVEIGEEQIYQVRAIHEKEKHVSPMVAASTRRFSEEELLNMVQYYTFRYFWQGAEPNSGMARERYHVDGDYPQNDKHVVTTGGTGFGLFSFPSAVERGWISRDEMLGRISTMVDFLEKADRFHGVWPHWLDGETGKVKPFSQKDDGGDLVESAFLIQGLLAIREYYQKGDEREQLLAQRIDKLWKEMEWDWYTKGGEDVLYWHWSPKHDWGMNFPLEGYNECLITYVLAAGSPTHRVGADAYHKGWARGGRIKTDVTTYGYDLALRHNYSEKYGGPLFWAHYSHIGLNPNGLKDRYADYFEHNRNHTLINRQWCIENPKGYPGYGEDLWGLTSSYSTVGYAGHKPGEDLGVISPTAALSSIVYTPEESMEVLINLYRTYGDKVFGKFGFYDAFSIKDDWYPHRYLAIDQGPIVSMIENHRTGTPWKLFMGAPEIQKGLEILGFEFQKP